MKQLLRKAYRFRIGLRNVAAVAVTLLLAAPVFAQAGNSPWENAVNVLQQAFTSTIARGLSLVAIVVAGLDVCFRRRRLETDSRGRALRRRHGNRRCQFSLWLFPG